MPENEIQVLNPIGERKIIPESSLEDAKAKGYEVISPEQLRQEEIETKYGTIGGAAEAAALGAGAGLSFGLVPYGLVKSGIYSEQELKDKIDANKGVFTTAEIASSIAPAILSGGSSLAAKGLSKTLPGMAAKLAKEAGQAAAAKVSSKAIAPIVNLATQGALEDVGYAITDTLTEDAVGDAELNAESLLSAVGARAAEGGMIGGLFGIGGKLAGKAVAKAGETLGRKLTKAVEDGDVGIAKWAGAGRKELKKLLQSESLDVKDFTDHVMDVIGSNSTKEDIIANMGLPKGDPSIFKAVTTNIDKLREKNLIARQASEEMMSGATATSNQSFRNRVASGAIKDSDMVYGNDIADYLRKEFIDSKGMTVDSRRSSIENLITSLDELGVIATKNGNTVRVPLTPDDIRQQSIIFGQLGFEKDSNTLVSEAARKLRTKLEKDVVRMIDMADPSGRLAEQYAAGKKLFQKTKTLDDLVQRKLLQEASNNRGFSLTEAVMTTAGAAAGGIPGAVAGYGLRKLQREYGDIALSAMLSKIGKRQDEITGAISRAAKGFVENSARAVRAGVAFDEPMTEKELDKAREEVVMFRSNPDSFVNSFVENNRELYQGAPKTAQALQAKLVAAKQFLSSKIPANGDDGSFDYKSTSSKAQAMAFKDYTDAIEDPYFALKKIGAGYSNPRYAEALSIVYPRLWQEFTAEVSGRIKSKTGLRQRERIGNFIKLKTSPAVNYQALQMIQSGMPQAQQQNPTVGKVSLPGARNIGASDRNMTGLDKTLNRA